MLNKKVDKKVKIRVIMNFMKHKLFFLVTLVALANLAFSQGRMPRFERDSRLDSSLFNAREIQAVPFARAAMVADGLSQSEIQRHLADLDAIWQFLSPQVTSLRAQQEQAKALLMFLHKKPLMQYRADQFSIAKTIDTGVFNDLSATMLFMYFAKRAGLPVVAEESPRHMFCVVLTREGPLDIEPTNPFGLNLGTGGGKSLFSERDYAGRHRVDDRRLIGKVYSNKITQLVKRMRYAEAVGLAIDAYEIQGRPMSAKRDIEDCVTKMAEDLERNGRDDEAIELLKTAEARLGPCDAWTRKIQASGRGALLAKIRSMPFEAALAEVDRHRMDLSTREWTELKESVYVSGEQKWEQRKDWDSAMKVVMMGLKEFPQSRKLMSAKDSITRNYEMQFHNEAADLLRVGKKEAAILTLKKGLMIMPDSMLLLGDLRKMGL